MVRTARITMMDALARTIADNNDKIGQLRQDNVYLQDMREVISNASFPWYSKDRTEATKGPKATFRTPSRSGGQDHLTEVQDGVFKCDCYAGQRDFECWVVKGLKKLANLDKVSYDVIFSDEFTKYHTAHVLTVT